MASTYIDRPTEQQDLLSRWLARAYTINWVMVAYIAIFVIAILTRFVNLGARVMSHDESLHTYYSWRLFTAGDYQHTPLMHGPILFHVTALMYFLFGDSDFTARLYPAILGVVLCMMPILFRRWLGRWGALLASIGLLISPLILYYNRYIREDTAAYVSALIMAYAIFMYLDGPEHLRRRARWLYLMVAGMIWTMGTKETSFMYIAIFGSILTLFWGVRLWQWARRQPSERLFHLFSVGILVGALFALGMYMVITVSLGNYSSLDTRVTFITQQIQAITSGQAVSSDFYVLIEWSLVALGLIVAIVLGTAVWATRKGNLRLRTFDIIRLLLLVLVVGAGLVLIEEKLLQPKVAADQADVATATLTNIPIFAEWIVCALILAIFAFAAFTGWIKKLYRFAEFDVLIILGTLVLPWLAAFFIKAMGADPTDYSSPGIQRAIAAVVPLLAVSTIVGLLWNWKRWLICALVFYIPFAFFFTTMFTNPVGLATGMIGSLGYWLEQQGVQRGSQPLYYYALVIMPVYEYLPVIGAFLAMLAGMVIFWRKRSDERRQSVLVTNEVDPITGDVLAADASEMPPEAFEPEPDPLPVRLRPGGLNRPSVLLFIGWWGVFIFLAFTLAGEKMPWLGTHLTLPLIFLTAWYFGTVFEHVEWSKFRSRGWLYLILLPLLGVAVFQAASPFLVGDSPFQGLERVQLTSFYQWLAVVAVTLLVLYLIIQVTIRVGIMHLRRMIGVAVFMVLALLTFRTAYMASFINYDDATEYLVYAHGAPGIKLMMQQIQDVSQRTTDGLNMKFAWGGNAWPVTWYFRDLTNATFFAGNPTPEALKDAVMVYASDDINTRVEPLLEDNYYKFTYIRMWWPDQEYFYLNPQRVENTLDFSSSNTNAAEIRKGMFDIWWKRDYTAYGQAIGKDYSLQNWPVSEKFYLYVRKDVAAQVWNMGTGEATVANPLVNTTASVCTSNWQATSASLVFGNGQNLQMNHPLDIAVDDASDKVYVAEEFNNRVSVFDENGTLLSTIQGGTAGFPDTFNRPNGVAVAPNSNLYVADTWNYMIRELAPDGTLIKSWGQAGQYGADAQTDPTDGLWGPRDVVTDANGNVYVSDTGNKRVRVYDANGNFIRDIGSAGSSLGQLDEPSGLAIDNALGRLYVADTWNKRISVFGLDGTPLTTFDVRGWYEDLGNRPYVAIDPTRHLVYVTDPDAGRVLVYDETGNCVGSFGQPSDTPTDNTQFNTIGGITTDAQGNVYVVDAAAARILKFAPFVDSVQPAPPPIVQNPAANSVLPVTLESTAEVQAGESTAQTTPELILPTENATQEAVG